MLSIDQLAASLPESPVNPGLQTTTGEASDNMDPIDDRDEDPFEIFKDVLDIIRLEKVSEYAFRIRCNRTGNTTSSSTSSRTFRSAELIHKPSWGSYNILFPVEFDDGVRWLLKVPLNGTRTAFDDFAAKNLTTEAMFMKKAEARDQRSSPRGVRLQC